MVGGGVHTGSCPELRNHTPLMYILDLLKLQGEGGGGGGGNTDHV